MKLRTVRGNPYSRRCACGCQAEIPVGNDVKVVVDLDTSRPRKNYLPAHSPDAGSWKARVLSVAPKIEEKSVASPPPGLALVDRGSVRDVAQVCACGCAQRIPPDPDLKVVVDFETSRPRLTYLPTHSPDYGPYVSPRAGSAAGAVELDLFEPATAFVVRAEARKIAVPAPPRPPIPAKPLPELAHASADATASPQAGRPWATSTLTFNSGQFESVRFGYADYARDGENEAQLRSRVHEVVLAEVEQQVRAVRALHERLGDRSVASEFVRPSVARS